MLPELVLDIADPVIEARVGAVTLRLRVDLDRRDTIELNPAVAARLPLRFEAGQGAEVGRVHVGDRVTPALVVIGGVAIGHTLSAYDRDCCTGTDGAIGPDLLPYDRVRFVRRGAPGTGNAIRLPLVHSIGGGLAVASATPAGTLFVRFSLGYTGTLATASAGAILARGYGGRMVGEGFTVEPAFGVSRPAQMLALARPAALAGFTLAQVAVRSADFGGGLALPSDPGQAGDIVVRGHGERPQMAWPSVLIGRDRLDRCSEIAFRREPPEIMLRCDPAP